MDRQDDSISDWVSPDVPCYAVVGKVNMGKSAVLATLLEEDDDRIIRISPEPGETTRSQRLSLVLDGVERLRFIDTPGFQQPVEALRRIRALHAESGGRGDTASLDTLRRFVDEQRRRGGFEDECRLLEPLLDGAGIVYVIDPSVAVYDSFLAEIEILRSTGAARLALLNRRSEIGAKKADHEAAWREHLSKAFNLVRGFDAHRARFAARRDLLAALYQIDERDSAHLDTTIGLLEAEWAERRERAAEHMIHFLKQSLVHREYASYNEDSATPEADRKAAVRRASERYFEQLSKAERETADALLDAYRHTAVRAAAADGFGEDLDLASDDTWQRLGLTRQQLTLAGAAVGAVGGVGLDAVTLGHSLGIGALIGGLGGGALAFFKGDALPTLKLDFGRVGALGGRRITLGPPRNPNFAWVLLDSVLIRYRQVLLRAHARRGDRVLAAGGDAVAERSVARALPGERQRLLARWFKQVAGRREDDEADTKALNALIETLAEIERKL